VRAVDARGIVRATFLREFLMTHKLELVVLHWFQRRNSAKGTATSIRRCSRPSKPGSGQTWPFTKASQEERHAT
jgi:hypothetical protein